MNQIRKINIVTTLCAVSILTAGVVASNVLAAATSNFAQVINPGTLTVDIVDSNYSAVTTPSVVMSAKTFNFACQKDSEASTGTFGTVSQQIYVKNPDAADNGWSVSLAAASPADVWHSSVSDYDFNDASGSGCNDGADTDSYAGQLTINPSVGTLTTGACTQCTSTNVTKGASASFTQGAVDSVTIITGAIGSDDIGDWKLSGVALSQTIPAEQAAANDYNINMTLSITAS